MNEYLSEMKDDMNGAIEALKKSLTTVRTGRATPALLDGVSVMVAAYGASMPIKQLATVNAPDARMLVVTPWDKSTISDIERAIASAGLGLNPANDGQVVRVPVPALTGDRRNELVRRTRGLGEDHKIRIRTVRKDYNDIFKNAEADKEISEDDLNRYLKQVQSATDDAVAKIDALVAAKEAEIQEI
ncbi:MAG: ribosome recycling factor [Myxococcota bacterium]|nr:ribosome recycling factor [Myxococcota bacterium]